MNTSFQLNHLEKATNEQLHELHVYIESEIDRRKATERKEAQRKIREMAEAYGIDLGTLVTKGSSRKPKYRCPTDQFKTWTGIGRKPNWVVEWLAEGKSLSDLEIT